MRDLRRGEPRRRLASCSNHDRFRALLPARRWERSRFVNGLSEPCGLVFGMSKRDAIGASENPFRLEGEGYE